MNQLVDSRLEEIQNCIENSDFNRASRRMLDFTYDFSCEQPVYQKALLLRKTYNESKELGKSAVSSELGRELSSFFAAEILTAKITLPEISEKGAKIASAREISKRYSSYLHNFHLEPIDIDLLVGEITGLVGENGNGKTTLLRMLAGKLSLNSGSFTYFENGKPFTDWDKIWSKVAYIPQRLEKWFGTAEENISFEAAIKGIPASENKDQTDFIIHRLGLTNFRELTWSQLSGGYKLRFEIAKALVWKPKLLILDEPLANLDIQAQEQLLQDFRNLADSLKNPVSIILSSQQLHEVESIADRLIFLKNGKAIHNGSLNEVAAGNLENTIEIAGEFNFSTLKNIFSDWDGVIIEQSASSFTITFSNFYSLHDFLLKLINANLHLDYYRNISKSTKKLFNDKY